PLPRGTLFPYTTLFRSNDLHREERVAADLEEAVVETHLIDLEELLPDACDCLRGRILRRPHVMSLCHGNDGFRQCLAVHLAVRRDRKSTRLNSSHVKIS